MQACEAPIACAGVFVPNRVKDLVGVPYRQTGWRPAILSLACLDDL
jgi:hypothetical protein